MSKLDDALKSGDPGVIEELLQKAAREAGHVKRQPTGETVNALRGVNWPLLAIQTHSNLVAQMCLSTQDTPEERLVAVAMAHELTNAIFAHWGIVLGVQVMDGDAGQQGP